MRHSPHGADTDPGRRRGTQQRRIHADAQGKLVEVARQALNRGAAQLGVGRRIACGREPPEVVRTTRANENRVRPEPIGADDRECKC